MPKKLGARMCPMLSIVNGMFTECEEDGCAWWQDDAEWCAVHSLHDICFELGQIKDHLSDIKDIKAERLQHDKWQAGADW